MSQWVDSGVSSLWAGVSLGFPFGAWWVSGGFPTVGRGFLQVPGGFPGVSPLWAGVSLEFPSGA